MSKTVQHVFASLLLLLAVAACDDPVTEPPPGGEADATLVSVFLTDAPGDVEAVWVDVQEIYLQGGEEGRTVLLDEPTGLIELTSLAGTAQPLVQNEEVESDSYGQLRFVIGGAVLETTDGRVYAKDDTEHPDGLETTGNLHCPSCSQSGIKVLLQGDDLALDGESEEFLLDFDVSQTFGRQAGQSGMWVMHPVIHGVDMTQMGSITGAVTLAEDEEGEPTVTIPACPDGTERGIEDFVPTATATTLTDDEGAPILRTGMTDADGSFQILGLAPDEYDLDYVGEAEFEGASLVWTAEVEPASADVGEGDEVSGVVYTITGASCEADEEEGEEG